MISRFTRLSTIRSLQIPRWPVCRHSKAPKVGIRVAHSVLPRVVIESGWNECIEDLHNDMQEWLIGGNDRVRAVIILKWSRVQTKYIRGFAELYMWDKTGMPHLTQTEVCDS